MKQAVLIIAHNNLELLRKNILLLNDKKIDIFIHVDKKSKIKQSDILDGLFDKELQKSHIEIFKEFKINWGGYTIVKTELLLIERCLKKSKGTGEKYSHLHLISGVDMPLKTPKEIITFFEKERGKEFVHFYSSDIDKKIKERYKYYHIFTESSLKRTKVYSIINRTSISLQKIFKVDRSYHSYHSYQYGAQWFSITSDFAEYVLSKKAEIKRKFRYTNCCDEVFLQTILINSRFKDSLYLKDFSDNYNSIMRLIDWNRGNPYVFRVDDFKELANSKMMFARKFDEAIDWRIIDKLYNYIMEKKREEN
ncbi:MAG: beta-1,6-N-acetylglucosaminyltransferase [Candidatus Saccharibacteria bacterium]|nr:beta-1,6-N-acetylglucosaminyltransferase [Candidatus Saccharibacteria bacterium]